MNNEPNFEEEKMKMPAQKVNTGLDNINKAQNKGPVIAIMAIMLFAILVGIFYWYKSNLELVVLETPPVRPTLETNKEPETTTATAQVESFSVMSTSDELNVIEADLESTNLDTLETELQQIEIELETVVE